MKKTIAAVLALAMVLTAIPTAAFAQEGARATDISGASIEAIADKTFTNEDITLTDEELIVKNGEDTLVPETDYTVSYENNFNAGQATVTVTGQGEYSGTLSANFNIQPMDFSGEEIPDITIPDQVQSDNSSIVGAEVVWKGKTLTENTDYTVEGNNSSTGYHRAEFTFKGNYSGTTSGFYRVYKESLEDGSMEVNMPEGGFTFDGKEKTPTVTITKDGQTLEQGRDYTLTYENNLNPGTAKVIAQGAGEYGKRLEKEFTIEKGDLSKAQIVWEKDSYLATGEAITPEFKVMLDDYQIPADQFTVVFADNTAIGTATVTLTAADKNFTGTLTGTFRIAGQKGEITVDADAYTKYLTSKVFNLNPKTNTDATGFTYESDNEDVAKVSPSGDVTIAATGKAVITIKTTGTQKFETAEKKITIQVKPLKPVFKVSSPAKGKIKVELEKVEGATKYQVHYGRMGKYYNRYLAHNDDGKDTVSVTISNRMKNKNYFVKVRSYKTLEDGSKVWGNWTVIRKVKTK